MFSTHHHHHVSSFLGNQPFMDELPVFSPQPSYQLEIQQFLNNNKIEKGSCLILFYKSLAEGRCPWKKMWKKYISIFLAFNIPRPPRSVHKKFQPIRSSRLAGYRQHIYIYIYTRMSCFIIQIEELLKCNKTRLLSKVQRNGKERVIWQ